MQISRKFKCFAVITVPLLQGANISSSRKDKDAPEGSWTCPECNNLNYPFRTVCNRKGCSYSKPTPTNNWTWPFCSLSKYCYTLDCDRCLVNCKQHRRFSCSSVRDVWFYVYLLKCWKHRIMVCLIIVTAIFAPEAPESCRVFVRVFTVLFFVS